MSYFGMGFGQSNIPRPQRKVSRLKKVVDYIDDKKIKYRSKIIKTEAELKDQRNILLKNFKKRRIEKSFPTAILFILILLLFVITIIKLVISLKTKYFSSNRTRLANSELVIHII